MSGGLGAAASLTTSEVRYNGVVKKLIPGTPIRPTHGFIECPETAILFGRDVFLHDQLAASLSVGQPVSFAVGLNAKGMPQAVDVVAEAVGPQDRQHSTSCAALVQVPTGERLCELILPEVTLALQNGMHQSVAAALVAAAESLGVAKDMQMHFAATLSQDSLLNAPAIRPNRSRPGGMEHVDIWHSGAGWWKPRQRFEPYGAAAHIQAPCLMQALMPGNGPFEGVVKNIAPKGAAGGDHTYGFVDCEETRKIYGRDVFLHSNQATELEVGVRVGFEVVLNQRGMPQAHNLVRLS